MRSDIVCETELRYEHDTVEEFGRPIRYSRVVVMTRRWETRDDPPRAWHSFEDDGEREVGPWRASDVKGPWMRSEAAAIDRFCAEYPAVVRPIVAGRIAAAPVGRYRPMGIP